MSILSRLLQLLNIYKNGWFAYVVLARIYSILRQITILGSSVAFNKLIKSTLGMLVKFSRRYIPGVDAAAKKEVMKSVDSIQKSMVKKPENHVVFGSIPKKALEDDDIRNHLSNYSKIENQDWKAGKVSGTIYHFDENLNSLLTEAYGLFALSNPLHPEIFPGVRQMEAEVVSMVARLFHGDQDTCGNVTSGGTESILMALKTYRDMASDQKGITQPEIVIPVTAHAAFDKGAHYFGIKIIHIPMDPKTGAVSVNKVKQAISRNTVMIAGSTPAFSNGIMDDIAALSAIATDNNIPLHVDCCLGGFIVPFMEKAGFSMPFNTDFRLPGVTSISVDTHKYGFAPKGSSVIVYRNSSIRRYQYFVQTEWPGGIYGSPTIAGSRPGALVAGAWVALLYMGEDGYIKSTRDIVSAARRIRDGINSIDGLFVIGDPLLSVVSFSTVPPLDTYAVADQLTQRGWHLNVLQFPTSIHIACTMLSVSSSEVLIRDLKDIVTDLKLRPPAQKGNAAAIYGTAASVPDRSLVADVTAGFLDGLTLLT